MLAVNSSRLTEMEPGELASQKQNQAEQLLSDPTSDQTHASSETDLTGNTIPLQDLQYLQLGY